MERRTELKGKTAIVTGAGRGIGLAIAKRLAANGSSVVLAARTAEQVEASRRLIQNNGGIALAFPVDVTEAEGVERLMDETKSRFGGIDILVNNAGSAPLATIDQMEPDVFDAIFATNVRSVYLCSRGVWPIMAEAGGGAIVNISSIAANDPFPGFAAYGAAKAFVNAYTKAVASEGRSCGIRVNAVAPGAVDTQMLRGAFPDFPTEKMLSPDDVAALVELLLLPGSHYVSGETIVIRKD